MRGEEEVGDFESGRDWENGELGRGVMVRLLKFGIFVGGVFGAVLDAVRVGVFLCAVALIGGGLCRSVCGRSREWGDEVECWMVEGVIYIPGNDELFCQHGTESMTWS